MDNTDSKPIQDIGIQSSRINSFLKFLSKCKIDYVNEREVSKKIRDINTKLEQEIKDARELEQSHRNHSLSSREMIGNLQETVSQLVHLKRDIKKMRDEIIACEATIATLEKDKENLKQKHVETLAELRDNREKYLEELAVINETKIQQVRHEADTKVAQFSCVIEELRNKIKELDVENRDKMNVVVLEYEEKIQRGAAHVAQLQEQLARQASRTDANIDAYKRRLEELEDQLKHGQFKQYLVQNTYGSQHENQVERPYSAARDYTNSSVVMNPVLTRATPKMTQKQTPKQSTLQVMYYGNTPQKTAEKKSAFTITKKRKLYSDKDYQDF